MERLNVVEEVEVDEIVVVMLDEMDDVEELVLDVVVAVVVVMFCEK